jgi:hypothetical protein
MEIGDLLLPRQTSKPPRDSSSLREEPRMGYLFETCDRDSAIAISLPEAKAWLPDFGLD